MKFRFAKVLVGLVGCDNRSVIDGAGEFESLTQTIFNGTAADQPHHDSVVSLHQLASGSV